MSEKRARPSRAQFIAVIVVTIALSVVVDFGRRMTATHRLQEVVKDMEREVATLEAEREILLTRRAYAGSDAAVEEWARKERIMVKEGETAVIPLLQGTPPPPTPTPSSQSSSAPAEQSHWQEWWNLFFGPPP